jgi:hypothetical protein
MLIHKMINNAQESLTLNKHSAVALKGGKLLAISSNNYGIHAEEHIVKSIQLQYYKYKKINKIQIIVIRSDKFGNLKNSKPCSNCIRLMRMIGIRKITYSTGNINHEFETHNTKKINSNWCSSLQKNIQLGIKNENIIRIVKRI